MLRLVPIAAAALLVSLVAVGADTAAFPLESDRRALSASFGEYRSGRLHAGVDLATFGKTGISVRAVRRGVVYRLRSSATGYGNVIYVRHRSGERSVYAHLEGFAPRLAALFPRTPHALGGDADEKAMEVYPSSEITVAENEIIGWNGESGSGLPHLHFEWRDASDRPLNPVKRGIIHVVDRVLPTITAILVEPADVNSSVNSAAFPVNALVDSPIRIKGRARVLVAGYDEDGRLGGRMAFQSVTMKLGRTSWAEIFMDSYSYGRDHETDRMYDPWRTGFGPTVYTLDLTTRRPVAEVMSGLGLLPEPSEATFVTIQVTDMSDNTKEVFFQIIPDRDPAAASPVAAADHIGPGGIAIWRNGAAHRLTTPGADHVDGSSWSIRDAGRGGAIELAAGVRLLDIPPGRIDRIYSLADADLPTPPQGVAKPFLLGPFGLALDRTIRISMPRVNNANGLARLSNDTWRWMETRVEDGRLVASLTYLAPIIAVRDATPPRITALRGSTGVVIEIKDDFSGVDAESVRVTSGGAVAGRFDPDRGWFHFRRPPGRRTGMLLIEATDHAGNRAIAEIHPATDRAFR